MTAEVCDCLVSVLAIIAAAMVVLTVGLWYRGETHKMYAHYFGKWCKEAIAEQLRLQAEINRVIPYAEEVK